MNNEFDVTVNVTEEGADAQAVRIEQAIAAFSAKMDQSLSTAGNSVKSYSTDLAKLIDDLSKLAVGINPAIYTQINELKAQIQEKGKELTKTPNNTALASEITQLQGVINSLVRQLSQAAAKDMSMLAGGKDAAGRARASQQAGELADIGNSLEAMSAKYATALRSLMGKFEKSVQDMQVMEFAKSPLRSLSSNTDTAKLQVQAQGIRAGLAANDQFGGTLARDLGVGNLQTASQELALKEQAVALLKQQQTGTTELSHEEQLLNREAQKRVDLENEYIQQSRNATRSLELNRQILSETNRLTLQTTLGGSANPDALKTEAKLANLRIQQLELQGYKQESAEIQQQIGLLRQIYDRQEAIVAADTQARAAQSRYNSLGTAIDRQQSSAGISSALGDRGEVLKAEARQANLRIQQLEIEGYRQEDVLIQEQIGILARVRGEQEALVAAVRAEAAARAQANKETRDQQAGQDRLTRSQQFAAGEGPQPEIAKNNIIGSRRLAQDPDVQASLLALQTGLSVNYALIGTITSAITGSISSVVEYDDKLRQLQAIAGATEGEFNKLSTSILETSKNTRLSAVELTEGATLLAQAGVSANQTAIILPKIADAAIATGSTFKNMAELVTTTMNVFNVGVGQTDQILNTFTAALNTSKLNIEQLSTAFQYSANIAADSGATYQELTAAISGIAQAGVRSGSMIGTGLRQVFSEMAQPTDKLTTLLRSLGLSMADVDVKTQGVTGVLRNLRDAGLTAEAAMGVFEKRTVSTLMAAVNQVDYMDQLERSLILSSAAEEAAAKSKESLAANTQILKNNLLALVNDAAHPYVAALISIVTSLRDVNQATGLLVPVMTLLMGVIGVAAANSVFKLVEAFVRYSEIGNIIAPVTTAITVAWNAFMLSIEAGLGPVAAMQIAMATLSDTVMALSLNPLMIGVIAATGAFLAINGVLSLTSSQFNDLTKQADAQKTSMNENQAKVDDLNTAQKQLEVTIQRLIDRHQGLTNGQDQNKNATAALSNESLKGAQAFNQYGAGIDSTGEPFARLLDKLQQTRVKIAQLTAETLKAQADMSRALGLTQGMAARSALGSGVLDKGVAAGQLQASGLSGKDADNFMARYSKLQAIDPTKYTQEDVAEAAALKVILQQQRTKNGTIRNFIAGMSTLGTGNPLELLSKNLDNFYVNANQAQSTNQQTKILDTQEATNRTKASPAYQAATRPFIATDLANSTASFEQKLSDAYKQYAGSGGKVSQEEFAATRSKIYADAEKAFEQGKTAVDGLTKLANSKDVGTRNAALDDAEKARETNQRLATFLTRGAKAQDALVKSQMGTVQGLARKGETDKAREAAKALGYDWSKLSANEIEVKAREEKTLADSNNRSAKYSGPLDPDAYAAVRVQALGVEGAQDKRAQSAAASAASKYKTLQKDTLAENMTVGKNAISLGEGNETFAEKSLTTIKTGTTEEDVLAAIAKAQAQFNNAEKDVKDGFDKQIAAQQKYVNVSRAFLSHEEWDAENDKLTQLREKKEQALKSDRAKMEQAISDALDKVPSIAHPFKVLIDAITRQMKALEGKLKSDSQEVEQIGATSTAYSAITARMVREGKLPEAVAAAGTGRYQAAQDAAQDRLLPKQIENMQGQKTVLETSLNNETLKNGAGETFTMADIATKARNGTYEDFASKQQEKIGQLQTAGDFTGAETQAKFLKDMQDRLPDVVAQSEKLVKVTTDLQATQAALAAAQAQSSQTWQQSLGQILAQYERANGMGQTLGQDLLNSVPQVLNQVGSSFKTFFNDIFTGTKSVGQSFKDLAAGIMNSLLQVAESEAAKAILKLIIEIGSSFLSGGGVAGTNVHRATGGIMEPIHRATGGDIPSFSALQGAVRQSGATEGRDSINTELMPGEYVLRKSAVDAIGKDTLDTMNWQGNRTMSANKPQAVSAGGTVIQQNTPFEIYMVSPDKTPPTSKHAIVIAAQEDMLNRGPLYKSVKAIMQGAV